MYELIDTPVLTLVPHNAEMSESVRAAVLAGYPAMRFEPTKISESFAKKIRRLNNFLIDYANKYILNQTANQSDTFSFDIQYLIKQFPDYNVAMNHSKWYIKVSESEKIPDIPQNIFNER